MTRVGRGPRRVVVVHEEVHFLAHGAMEAARQCRLEEARRAQERERIADARKREEPVDPRGAEREAGDDAADEREPVDARGMRQGVGDADPGAERVPDQGGLAEAERLEEAVQREGEVREAVVRAGLRRRSEAGQVEGVDRRLAREQRHVVPPRLGEAAQAVHEHDRRTASVHDVVETEPVDLAAAEPDLWHAATILPDRRRDAGPGGAGTGRG